MTYYLPRLFGIVNLDVKNLAGREGRHKFPLFHFVNDAMWFLVRFFVSILFPIIKKNIVKNHSILSGLP